MSEVRQLKLQKELNDWHSQRLSKQIQKLQLCCKHEMQKSSSMVVFDYEYCFFYNKVTNKCVKCGVSNNENITGW